MTRRRGGTLDDSDHRLLAEWAADCAEHVLGLFAGQHPDDPRPAREIGAARAWAAGEITMTQARRAAVEAHAAARAATGAARDTARAAGHAAAVAHMADHELGVAYYALRATRARGGDVDAERAWQLASLPEAGRRLTHGVYRRSGRTGAAMSDGSLRQSTPGTST